jgi:hypothetical protein
MSGSPVQTPRWILYVLSLGLAFSLAGVGTLGYFLWDLNSHFSRAGNPSTLALLRLSSRLTRKSPKQKTE